MADEFEPSPVFNSLESGKPFVFCSSCSLPLREEASSYNVGKSFHRGECVFEYALCEDCRDRLYQESSEESRQAIAMFMQGRIDFTGRSDRLFGQWKPESWIECCAICDTPRSESERYSINGAFAGNGIMFDPYPLCICGDCEEELSEVVSKKTRDVWDDFIASHFDGPPAGVENLPAGHGPMIF